MGAHARGGLQPETGIANRSQCVLQRPASSTFVDDFSANAVPTAGPRSVAIAAAASIAVIEVGATDHKKGYQEGETQASNGHVLSWRDAHGVTSINDPVTPLDIRSGPIHLLRKESDYSRENSIVHQSSLLR